VRESCFAQHLTLKSLLKGLIPVRWTRKTIVDEIRRLHGKRVELNYSSAETNHLNLVRAGAWHFGTWRQAIEAAGIDYDKLAKYQRWDRERIVERIQQLHAHGADLSWRSVSTHLDPPLAAAALRSNGFSSWREAIRAAGLDIDAVARYKFWNRERVVEEIQSLRAQGHLLSSKLMQDDNQALFCAARRRFGSWDNALEAAGFDVASIRMRKPTVKPRKSRRPAIAKTPAGRIRRKSEPRKSVRLNGHGRPSKVRTTRKPAATQGKARQAKATRTR